MTWFASAEKQVANLFVMLISPNNKQQLT